jgi:hypothetical protein
VKRRGPSETTAGKLASTDPDDWVSADEQREIVDLVDQWRAGSPWALPALTERYGLQEHDLWGPDPRRRAVLAIRDARRRDAGREFAASSGRDRREVAAQFGLGWCSPPE